jgi:leucyl-tRNA synthetase
MGYPFEEIEPKWQTHWSNYNTFKTNTDSKKPKFYCLDMFPYPSGAGLHVGHPEGYTATDIVARFKRMNGYEVLHPMGWDAFGLPAERYAMTTGIHPRITTKTNIDTFRKQIQMLGLSYDWEREISTTDPEYFQWTQSIFLKIYHSYYDTQEKKAKPITSLISKIEKNGSYGIQELGYRGESFTANEWKEKSQPEKDTVINQFRLVYLAQIPVNWCEGLGTVLANEEVEEWVAKGYSVVRRPMRQYMMRITAYAERLLEDLSLCSWPVSTLEMQKNWIGKSEGVELDFSIHGSNKKIKVYTTRPDTLFGATYLVLAPEHPLVGEITQESQKSSILEYQEKSSLKSDLDRTELNKAKTGCFTGAYAENPALPGSKIPIYISDYVLVTYGTGAIMAVPAHDKRDYEFAVQFQLPILDVIYGRSGEGAFDSKSSYCINSDSIELHLNGLNFEKAFREVSVWVEKKGIGTKKIQYKLRDWLFARQRYWGEPIPLVHLEDGSTISLSESELPLELPDLEEFKPSGTGESPLALAKDWLQYTDQSTGKKGKRETNTMPQWAGSCWYYLRYISPGFKNGIVDPEFEKKWMPVDIYVGGAEHAVLHLLYSRFWHKILYDLGIVSTKEPFQKLIHQGLILGEDKRKMSKSLGNVINPDEVVKQYGADSLRLFEMFMGPFEMVKPWSMKGVEGVSRFLDRVWRLFHTGDNGTFHLDDVEPDLSDWKILHKTIQKVSQDIENFSFNTAISQMMIFVNEINPKQTRPRKILEPFVLLLSPFAPHIAEEIWEKLGHKETLAYESFPSYDPKYVIDEEMTIVIQVNGKLRGELSIPKDTPTDKILSLAKNHDKIMAFLNEKPIKKEIYVPQKLVNLVV